MLALLKNNGQKVYRPKEIAKHLGYTHNKDYRLFREVLTELEDRRLVNRVKGNRFTMKPRATRLEGTLTVNPKGFGFVRVEGFSEDFFVRGHNLGTALDGDRVLIGRAASSRRDGRAEAEVLKVLERSRKRAVGTFRKVGNFGLVMPDDLRLTHDVYVPREAFHGAKDGDKVEVSIVLFKNAHARPEGKVLSILGKATDPAVQVLALAMSMDVRAGFPDDVIAEAEAITASVDSDEIARRLDLRATPTFTIDPDDAKDFDDAIHVRELAGGNVEVGVHIADVSHFVCPGTALDGEAYERGTSVYLVDRVIPMLPERLSNEVCSLRPDEDKLTFSCIMEVTPEGEVARYDLCETVIRSHHRFTYADAQALLDEETADHARAADVRLAAKVAHVLTKKRMASGAIDFDLPEIKVILDKDGRPERIVKKERKEANRLIEELMLLANRTVAAHIGKRKGPLPFVYRIHDDPDPEKISRMAEFIRAFGHRLKLKEGRVTSEQLNQLLHDIKGKPEEPVIENATLRAMAKARYSTKNIGHFGLSFSHYTHFTSPIRRYPDLMVHRLLKAYEGGAKNADAEELEKKCDYASARERAAIGAERESVKLKQVEYVAGHLGEQFSGVVSGVTHFGLFVELSDLLVEGMIHVRDMGDDYYEYDEQQYTLRGVETGRAYRLGNVVQVVVARADVDAREVDFLFA